jgi:hypothetical protein
MDLTKSISELRSQRDKVEEAIQALERLMESRRARRGRPPKWLIEARAVKPDAGGAAEQAGPG